jgi:hypothetical protein
VTETGSSLRPSRLCGLRGLPSIAWLRPRTRGMRRSGSVEPRGRGGGDSRQTSAEYEENTKRTRREYEENTKAPPKQPLSNALAVGLFMACGRLYPEAKSMARPLTGIDEFQRTRRAPTAPGRCGFPSSRTCFCMLRAGPARGPVAGAFRPKFGCLTRGAGNMLLACGGTEAGIGKVPFTPNECREVLNEELALPRYELGVRQPRPGGFGQTPFAGWPTRRRPTF